MPVPEWIDKNLTKKDKDDLTKSKWAVVSSLTEEIPKTFEVKPFVNLVIAELAKRDAKWKEMTHAFRMRTNLAYY